MSNNNQIQIFRTKAASQLLEIDSRMTVTITNTSEDSSAIDIADVINKAFLEKIRNNTEPLSAGVYNIRLLVFVGDEQQ